jgi:hypothetical protein
MVHVVLLNRESRSSSVVFADFSGKKLVFNNALLLVPKYACCLANLVWWKRFCLKGCLFVQLLGWVVFEVDLRYY